MIPELLARVNLKLHAQHEGSFVRNPYSDQLVDLGPVVYKPTRLPERILYGILDRLPRVPRGSDLIEKLFDI